MESVLSGKVEILRGALQKNGVLDFLTGDVLDHISQAFGETVRNDVAGAGLDRLHHFLRPEQILALQQQVEADWWRRWRDIGPPLAEAAFGDRTVRIGARVWFRAIPPAEVTERLGDVLDFFSGKIGPAAPHRDTWAGIPVNGITVWAAMTDCQAEHGLVYYPESWDRPLNWAKKDFSGMPGQQEISDVAAGDAVLFAAHHLHGSVPNRSDRTRLTASIRATVGVPRYGVGHSAWMPFVETRHIGSAMESVQRLQCMATRIFPKWVATARQRRRRTARYTNRFRARLRKADRQS